MRARQGGRYAALLRGANIEATDAKGWTLLATACARGTDAVRFCLDRGADVDRDAPPLHRVWEGHLDAARLCAERGEWSDERCEKAVAAAHYRGHANVAAWLAKIRGLDAPSF